MSNDTTAKLAQALRNMVDEFEGCYADGEPAMIAARQVLAAHEDEKQAGPVAGQGAAHEPLSAEQIAAGAIENGCGLGSGELPDVAFIKGAKWGAAQVQAPPSESDKEDAELLDTLESLLQDGSLTIKTVNFLSASSRVQISFADEEPVGDSFTLRDAIRAARAKKEQQ